MQEQRMKTSKEKFNLGYKFGGDLREVPENPISMRRYVDFLNTKLKEISDPPKTGEIRAAVKLLGEIGAYAKILRLLPMATQALERSLHLIEEHSLAPEIWAIHTLRLGDVQRFHRNELEAETSFRSVLEMIERRPELAPLADFAWQNLGKLRFDQKNFEEARKYFENALALRKKKGQAELIQSTELALRVLVMKSK